MAHLQRQGVASPLPPRILSQTEEPIQRVPLHLPSTPLTESTADRRHGPNARSSSLNLSPDFRSEVRGKVQTSSSSSRTLRLPSCPGRYRRPSMYSSAP